MRLLLISILLLATMAGCTEDPPLGDPNGGSEPAPPATDPGAVRDPVIHEVDISNFAFNAQTVTIFVGDTVTWTNLDNTDHTVSAEGYEFESGTIGSGATFSFTFDEVGNFGYRCDFHPSMVGWVVVE